MNNEQSSFNLLQQRVVRVFISSTFRDMMEEREELVKRVFPQLRKLCEQRGVTWGEVDLRWGVTDEQKAEGKVLPICLAEIHRCRPYFIGILGERYGWVPDEIPQELIDQEPWLKDHLHYSVIELEILHGVLRNPDMAEHAFFYLRDPAYIESLPPVERNNYTAENAESAEKLQNLKDGIRSSGFPVRENYPDPKALGEFVLKDITDVINKLYPEVSKPAPLDREKMEHEAFAQSRAKVYIGRKEYFERLDEHVKGNGPPLVILGESGVGKSALLSNWALEFQKNNPKDFLLIHFIGASPYSADWAAMIRRIMSELKRRFDIQQEIPDKPDELKMAFANSLHMAAAKGRVILILDALNQLEDRDGAPDLVWLPPYIPPNVRLIVSTLPGRPLEELKKRGWPDLKVEPLNKDERKLFIKEYLAQYTKALSPELAERIASAEQTANPLYLKALLEELRVFGIHEYLDKRINLYLEAQTIPELYEKILARYEEDYERDRPGLVRDMMTIIWGSRKGLQEIELLELLGTYQKVMSLVWKSKYEMMELKDFELLVSEKKLLPCSLWSPLYLAAEQNLINRNGLIYFSNEYFRQAIKQRYFQDENQEIVLHALLAYYFQNTKLNLRIIEELPWQYSQAKAWNILYTLLSDPCFFNIAYLANEFDIRTYWAQIQNNSSLNILDAYKMIITSPLQHHHEFIMQLTTLLDDMGYSTEVLLLLDKLIDHYHDLDDLLNLQYTLTKKATVLYYLGKMNEAKNLHIEAEFICRKINYKKGLALSLQAQTSILNDQGDFDGAMAMLQVAEKIFREENDIHGLSSNLIDQAYIYNTWGKLDHAMSLLNESEHMIRVSGNKDALINCLINKANILNIRGDLSNAKSLLDECDFICRQLGDKWRLTTCLGYKAEIFMKWGDLSNALELCIEKELLCNELKNLRGLQNCLGTQGTIFWIKGNLDRAMELFKKQEAICRNIGLKSDLQACLGNQGLILMDRGDLDKAMTIYKEKERICNELNYKVGLSIAIGNQACILLLKDNLTQAMELFKKQECLCREVGDLEGIQESLGNQAIILRRRGDSMKAMELLKEQEDICNRTRNMKGLCSCLNEQALLLKSGEKFEMNKAMNLFKKSEKISREIKHIYGISVALANQSSLLIQMNKPAQAIPLALEAYDLANNQGLKPLADQIKTLLEDIKT